MQALLQPVKLAGNQLLAISMNFKCVIHNIIFHLKNWYYSVVTSETVVSYGYLFGFAYIGQAQLEHL